MDGKNSASNKGSILALLSQGYSVFQVGSILKIKKIADHKNKVKPDIGDNKATDQQRAEITLHWPGWAPTHSNVIQQL